MIMVPFSSVEYYLMSVDYQKLEMRCLNEYVKSLRVRGQFDLADAYADWIRQMECGSSFMPSLVAQNIRGLVDGGFPVGSDGDTYREWRK